MPKIWPLIAILFLTTECAHSPQKSKSESKSVVKIDNMAGPVRVSSCAGVAISRDEIATAAHCVHDPYTGIWPTIKTRDGQECRVHSATKHEDTDAGLFRVSDCKLHPATSRVRPIRQGEDVSVVGHPLGEAWSLSVGVVSRVLPKDDDGDWLDTTGFIQTDAATNMGNSGGGMFDMNGHLVGVISYIRTPDRLGHSNSGLGYATPIKNVLRLR